MRVGTGATDLQTVQSELDVYTSVLLGKKAPPEDRGVSTLLEYAAAIYARALEIEMQLLRLENNGGILKGGRHYRFRTGELRSFLTMCKTQVELGSRRVTIAQMELESEKRGIDL